MSSGIWPNFRDGICPGRKLFGAVGGLPAGLTWAFFPLLARVLGSIAVALAGRAGSRLAAGLGVPAGRQVMLRLIMTVPDPAAAVPRVLGVDDFAIRRGQHYGMLLIDCQTRAPLDLFEGRDAQPLADWLTAHPGAEVVCRDPEENPPCKMGDYRVPGRRPDL